MGSLDKRLYKTIRSTIAELLDQVEAPQDSVIYLPLSKGQLDRIELQGKQKDISFVTNPSRVIFV
jgi:hypothetical protein